MQFTQMCRFYISSVHDLLEYFISLFQSGLSMKEKGEKSLSEAQKLRDQLQSRSMTIEQQLVELKMKEKQVATVSSLMVKGKRGEREGGGREGERERGGGENYSTYINIFMLLLSSLISTPPLHNRSSCILPGRRGS